MEGILIFAGICVIFGILGTVLVTIRGVLHVKTKDGVFMDCIYVILIIYTIFFLIFAVKNGINNYRADMEVKTAQKEIIDILKNVTYESYTDEKYGYTIKYPSFLNVVTKDSKANGASFKSDRNGITGYLEVFGEDNDSKETMEKYCANDIYYKEKYFKESKSNNEGDIKINRVYGTPSNKSLKDDEYILSWQRYDKTYYRYVIVGVGSIHSFEINYSNKEQEYYERIIDSIYTTFKTPEINYTHKKYKKTY